MRRMYTLRFGSFAIGFAVANLFAAVAIVVASSGLAHISSHVTLSRVSLGAIVIAAGPCSLIGGSVAAYCDRYFAQKNACLEKGRLLAVIVVLSHALFVMTACRSIL